MGKQHTDKRVILTKKALAKSLIELLRIKSIHEITIKEICERADVNRTTFYNHYISVYELYDNIIDYIYRQVKKKQEHYIADNDFSDISAFNNFFMSVFEYAEENRDLFLVILGRNGCITIGEAFTKYIDNFIKEKRPSAFSRYSIQFVSAGVSHILWLWLNEEDRIPATKIVNILSCLFGKGIEQAIISGIRI